MHEQDGSQQEQLEVGMQVEATKGDFGEADVSKPRIKEIHHDSHGQPEQLIVQKGVLFQKRIAVPVERIQQVNPVTPDEKEGNVVLTVSEQEADALSAQGKEQLASEQDLLQQVQETLPTAEGLRRLEATNASQRPHSFSWWRLLGPGFLSGMAGNDASAVGAYSVDGSQVGFGHLWLMLLATPLYQAVQYTCAKVGRVSGQGLAQILRSQYRFPMAALASLVLVVANLALLAADLVAISSGLELLTGIGWIWFVVPFAGLLWYVTVYQHFALLKKIFVAMSLVFGVYLITAVLAKPDAGVVLFNTFVPHVDLTFASLSSAVALLGATISPYTMYWQVQGEKEERRPGRTRATQIRFAALDVLLGAIGGNVIAYCIMLTTAATLFPHHQQIQTVVDTASALTPLLGPFARYLFAIGFIGAGLVAIPVLLASTSYAVAGTFGWPGSLSKQPWQNEGFYLILSGAMVVSLVLALLRVDPIRLIFWANVLNGVLSPVLVAYLFLVARSCTVMRRERIGWWTTLGLLLTFLVMVAASLLLFAGLLTGKGGS